MKLTKKLESEILKVYNSYWDSYFKGDMRAFASLLHENVQLIGSSENEVFSNKRSAMKFYKATAGQVAGKAGVQNRKIAMRPVGSNVLVIEQSDFYVLIDNEWSFYGNGRISTLLQKTDTGWKIIHEHGSLPDSKAGEGEQVNTEKIKAENRQLREAIKRRTIELEVKNRELEIETALEKVRAIAMGMKEPADMLDVCKTISLQLQSIGVNEIRNVQTAIFYEQRGTYMNYEYYAKHNKTFITETTYTNNKIHKAFAVKMLKGKGEYFVTHIKGKRVKDWIAYQKTTNVFIDKYLNKASSLNYYWFSLGPVALGISTYHPLTEEEIDLFKRFLKVFELAYRRYLDIEKAEAQTREAQIEASLEKVRSSAMAMHKSTDISSTTTVIFEELKKLNIKSKRCGIGLLTKDSKSADVYAAATSSDGKFHTLMRTIDMTQHESLRHQYDSWIRQENYETILKGEELKSYYKLPFFQSSANYVPTNHFEQSEYGYYIPFSKGLFYAWSENPYKENEINILNRFKSIIELTFRRFFDLQKAEAQAREAQIQLALERVRARTMAMHKSDELSETAYILFQQFKELGEDPIQITIGFFNEEKEIIEFRITGIDGSGSKIEQAYNMSINEPTLLNKIYKAWKAQKKSLVIELTGKELIDWISYRSSLISNYHTDSKINLNDRRFVSAGFFSKGMITISKPSIIPEESIQILERFAGVFDLTHTRFLDLQKAEAQAREAQIELALERVRAKSMAMHKSGELLDVIAVVSEQLENLGFKFDIVSFAANNQEYDYNFWMTVKGQSHPYRIYVPYINNPMFENVKQAQLKGDTFYTDILTREENKQWHQHLFEHNKLDFITDKLKKYVYNSGYARSIVLLPKIMLIVGNYSSLPYSDIENNIIKRFANVFDQVYTRFLDLQKAEAQAREAQIETALERVRSRTMGMQKSEELPEVANVLFQQIKALDMPIWSTAFNIFTNDKNTVTCNVSSEGQLQPSFIIPLTKEKSFKEWYDAIKSGDTFFVQELGGKDLESHYRFLFTLSGVEDAVKPLEDKGITLPTYQINHISSFKRGFLMFITYEKVPEAHDIFKRFTVVFEQTYTRFLDLQKAEAQAREAEIELALERVRARTMGMQKSEELKEVIQLVYEQFVHLKIHIEHTGFILDYKARDDMHIWLADQHLVPSEVTIPCFDSPPNNSIKEAKEKGQDFFKYLLTFEEKNKFYRDLFKFVPGVPEETLEYYFNCPGLAGSGVLLDNIGLYIENFSGTPYTDEENNVLMRFGKVFQQTYTRFLDLQKAEAQSRESQIQLALERVRARTMAMQKSDELQDVVHTLLERLKDLNVEFYTSIIILFAGDSKDIVWWLENKEKQQYSSILVPYADIAYLRDLFDARENGSNHFSKTYSFEEKNELFHHLFSATDFQYVPEKQRKFLLESNAATMSVAIAKNTGIHLTRYTDKAFSEEDNAILKRFVKVFEQTYTRFLDLQKAEAQAREAEIELALERVRAVAMGMNKSEDLLRICEISFKEFKKLGFDNLRNAVIHMLNDEKRFFVDYDYSDYLGGSVININYNSHPVIENYLEQIKKADDAFAEVIVEGKELDSWKDFRKSGGQLDDPRLDGIPALYYYLYSIGFGDIGISTFSPIDESQIKILKRFRNVFDLAYRRYNDIALAEAQAKEAQIEAALERVRSRTMGMQKSNELGEAASLLFKQVSDLGIQTWTSGFNIWHEENTSFIGYNPTPTGGITPPYMIPSTEDAFFLNILQAKKRGVEFIVFEWEGESLAKTYRYMKTLPIVKDVLTGIEDSGFQLPTYQINHCVFFAQGFLLFITLETYPQAHDIFKRFGKVFEQTYTRFLDLQKAEAQAREAKIEASLERVRSRTMAMHQSNELAETASVLFKQLIVLGIEPNRLYIAIMKDDAGNAEFWITDEDGSKVSSGFSAKLNDNRSFNKMFEGWKRKDNCLIIDMQGKELQDYFEHLGKLNVPFKGGLSQKRRVQSIAYFSQGFIGIASPDLQPEKTVNLLERFAAVFNLTYRRFLDLQKAEEQAREAQIEAALERVRSMTMGMQRSDELQDAALVLFRQVEALGVPAFASGFNIWDDDRKVATAWMGGKDRIQPPFKTSSSEDIFLRIYEAAERGESLFVEEQAGAALKTHYEYMISIPVFKEVADKMVKEGLSLPTFQIMHCAYFSKGYLMFITFEPVPNAYDIFKRFAKVFEQTYTRFLDLQKAEAQTREAKIEASLERVRSKAMAMHSPDDLSETVNVFFKELKTLGIIPIRCGVGQIDEATRTTSLTTTTSSQQGESFRVTGKIKQTGHPVLDGIFDHWKLQKEYHPVLEGEDITAYYNVMNAQIGYPEYPEGVTQYGNCFYFKEGFVFAWTENKLSEEELQIFRRFTSVLSLTYRRFMDLKEAEARAIEALRQASLDRVRAEIASMRTMNDLEKITPLIWRELTTLGVPFFRCGVFIFDEPNAVAHAYLSTPLGKSLAALHVKINNTWLENAVKHWRQGKIYHEVWNREQFIAWTKNMMEQGFVENKERFQAGKEAPETLALQLLPFAQGMLYVGSKQPLSQEEINMAEKLADDFGVAYSRYEDFKKLETANFRKTAELEEARQLQLAMLPKIIPNLPNLDIAVYMQTATEVGGDYYDFHVGEDGTLTAVIGDATGHGMKAGTMVTITKSLFNSLASNENILDTFTSISSVIKDMKFRQLSMCLQMIKIKENQLSISSAAMPPALIYRKKIKRVEEIFIKAMPLGTMSNFPYSVKETLLEKGDTILLMSDGFPELQNGNSEMYGYDRGREKFEKAAETSPEDIIRYLKNDAAKWAGDKDPDDDVTFVVIKLK